MEPRRYVKKGRYFVLLEILISLTLIALCAIPLISPHFLLQREEIHRFEEMALIPHADNAFCQVKERFYDYDRFGIYWPNSNKTVFDAGTLPSVTFPVQGNPEGSKWLVSYRVTLLDQGQKNTRRYRILQVAITFSNAKEKKRGYEYLYHLYVWRQGDKKGDKL